MAHPDFELLATSWDLTLRADGYSRNTIRTYQTGLASLAGWLGEHHPEVGPAELGRDHVRGWLAHIRDTRGATSAKTWFAGVRHFTKWMVAEGEATTDATEKVTYPAASEPATPVLSPEDLKRLLAGCAGADFTNRRDRAILMVLVDGGLRAAELRGLRLEDVNLADRMLYVVGKGLRRSGPRHRAVPLGIKAAQSLDRYMRERRKHPYAASDPLWLGSFGQPGPLSESGLVGVLKRRGERAGIKDLHPHMFRHSWAHAFRAAGGGEGDLMVLGGWRSRTQLDRYGASAAADRAAEAYRRLSLGDRL